MISVKKLCGAYALLVDGCDILTHLYASHSLTLPATVPGQAAREIFFFLNRIFHTLSNTYLKSTKTHLSVSALVFGLIAQASLASISPKIMSSSRKIISAFQNFKYETFLI